MKEFYCGWKKTLFLTPKTLHYKNMSAFFLETGILKNHTHVKKVGTPQNFLLAFIDELWKTRKISILEKWKKIAGDIIILHMCTKNHNHMS